MWCVRVNFLLLGLGWVTHLWFGKFPPKNLKVFNFFPFGSKKSLWIGSKSTPVKDGSASYLLRIKSMIGSGQGLSLVLSKMCFLSNIIDRDAMKKIVTSHFSVMLFYASPVWLTEVSPVIDLKVINSLHDKCLRIAAKDSNTGSLELN